jgi:hypothetical protein
MPLLCRNLNQRLTLSAVRVQRNVHRVAMIEPPLVVNGSLAKYRNGQGTLERLLKEGFDWVRL